MPQIAEMMGRVLHNRHDAAVRAKVREEVRELCARFLVYTDLTCA
jgi:glycine/serine hydroxymethyltransferase